MAVPITILVTGGAGFIGSAFIRHVLGSSQDRIINVDCLTYASRPQALAQAAALGEERYVFRQINVGDATALAQVFRQYQPDAVVHLAAESHVDRSIAGPAVFMQTNVMGTYTLLETALAYWNELSTARQQRFRLYNVSTDEVFGDLADWEGGGRSMTIDEGRAQGSGPASVSGAAAASGPASVSVPTSVSGPASASGPASGSGPAPIPAPAFTEDSPYRPSSPYSASKAAADHLVRAWGRTWGLPVLISHCTNNYGPWQHEEKFIPTIIHRAQAMQPVPIYGDGRQIRDWLHVEDHARALDLILRAGVPGQSYNIGAHERWYNHDLAVMICDWVDELAGDRQRRRLLTTVADRPGHDRCYALDAQRLRQELGWEPRITLREGLRQTVAWYLAQGQVSR